MKTTEKITRSKDGRSITLTRRRILTYKPHKVAQVVHYLNHGMSACLKKGPPAIWPPNHMWASEWQHVTCPDCLKGRDEIQTYQLSEDGKAITCLRCGCTSYNKNDVDQHYCGNCHVAHDSLWPPARRAWLAGGRAVPPS